MALYHPDGTPNARFVPGVMRPTQIGCPYHGLLVDANAVGIYSTLYDYEGGPVAINDANLTWPSRASSATQLIKVPGLPSVSRTPAQQALDAQYGMEWRNYALVADNMLHGRTLPAGWVIYIDPANTPWLITLETQQVNSIDWQVTVTLKAIFGRFATEPYPAINRQLDQFTDVGVAAQSGEYVGAGGVGSDSHLQFERNPTGSVVYSHVYHLAAADVGPLRIGDAWAQLWAVQKIQISGTGSTDRSTLGDGITATITSYKGTADCYQFSQVVVGTLVDQTYGTGVLEDSHTSTEPSCPCTDDFISEYVYVAVNPTVTNTPHAVDTSEYLLRLLFDKDGNEVAYSALREVDDWSTTYETTAGSITETRTWEAQQVLDGGSNCIGCEKVDSGNPVIVRTGDITKHGVHTDHLERRLTLKRNGITVDQAEAIAESVFVEDRSIEWTYGSWELDGSSSSDSVELDGAALAETEVPELRIHPYSPQVMGIMAVDYPHNATADWAKLYRVAVPWGSDATHRHVQLNKSTGHHPTFCTGSCDPENEFVTWLIPGVTDTYGSKVNYV